MFFHKYWWIIKSAAVSLLPTGGSGDLPYGKVELFVCVYTFCY